MDFLIEQKQDELYSLQLENTFAKLSSSLYVSIIESQNDDIMIESSIESFKDGIMKIISKVYEDIKKIIKKISMELEIKFKQMEINNKLKELKDILAKKKLDKLGRKFDYVSLYKYKKYYTEFINRYTAELLTGLNKDFKSIDEYEKWRKIMLDKLSDFDYKMSDEEQWKISISINSAIELSEKEAMNREKNLKMVEEEGSRSIKKIENYYEGLDMERSYVNVNSDKFSIPYKIKYKFQHSFIGLILSKLTQTIRTIARFISKHTVGCITALIILLLV